MGTLGFMGKEPLSIILLEVYPEYNSHKLILKDMRWTPFIKIFCGYDNVVTQDFAWGFNGYIYRFGDLVTDVLKELVAQATRIPQNSD